MLRCHGDAVSRPSRGSWCLRSSMLADDHTLATIRSGEYGAVERAVLRVLLLQAGRETGARVGVQLHFADAHELGGDLDALVFASEFEALLQGQLAGGRHPLEGV